MIVFSNRQMKKSCAENGQMSSWEFRAVKDFSTSEKFVLIENMQKFLEKVSFDAGIIFFDAHGCLAKEHGFTRAIIEKIPGGNLLLVGTRHFEEGERLFLQQEQIKIYPASALAMDAESVCDGMMEIASGWKKCYVLMCADVLEPVFAKVSLPEHGGLSVRELLYFVQRLRMLRNFVGAVLVDFEQCSGVAEKLVAEFTQEIRRE